MEENNEQWFYAPSRSLASIPFWAWNGKLEPETLAMQIDNAEKMGYAGFIMHARIGLQTPFLNEQFLGCIRFCQEYAQKKGMQAWLYDEDKWPSGFGGGRVTKDREFRARYLLLSRQLYPDGPCKPSIQTGTRITAQGTATLLASYCVRCYDGKLESYRHLLSGKQGDAETWYLYQVVLADQPWFNNQAYTDLLNPEAVRRFIDEVYEPYAKTFSGRFPENMPVIFTDEPQLFTWQRLQDPGENAEAGIAYSGCMQTLFRERCGKELLDVAPELFWNWADGKPAVYRYTYCDLLADQFNQSYAGILSPWCRAHGLALTGHLMDEATLGGQCRTSGDLMRCYENYDLPGVDILADRRENTTVKQAQSITRQLGKKDLLCELYGATNWNFDFRQKKLQGDWLAALGVTKRVPHLMWMTMDGEAKRDYPAPLDAHSPWYLKNTILETHYARLGAVLRRGKNAVRIGVVHPGESCWLLYGEKTSCAADLASLEDRYRNLVDTLVGNAVDFDILNEALMQKLPAKVKGGKLHVGEMTYEVVILPRVLTLRKNTLQLLASLAAQGGVVIRTDDEPRWLDGSSAVPAKEQMAAFLYARDLSALLKRIDAAREVWITTADGVAVQDLACQIRDDGEERWLLIAHINTDPRDYDPILIRLRGFWKASLYDTMRGEVRNLQQSILGQETILRTSLPRQDSLLIRLQPSDRREVSPPNEQNACICSYEQRGLVNVVLEEKNTLLLDQMEYALDNSLWHGEKEILCIDNEIRSRLGFHLRTDAFPQPWLRQEKPPKTHLLRLRCQVYSDDSFNGVSIVWEGGQEWRLRWNRQEVPHTDRWYVDRCLRCDLLPGILKGNNLLELEIPFGAETNLEWCYLLGRFGVRKEGNRFALTKLPQMLYFGDYSVQGLPFYGGNLIYSFQAEFPAGEAEIEVKNYHAPLLEIWADDSEAQAIICAPYQARLTLCRSGIHTIYIRCFGSRINTFGQVHNCNFAPQYFGPASWRTTGSAWSNSYRTWPCGVDGPISVRVFRGK